VPVSSYFAPLRTLRKTSTSPPNLAAIPIRSASGGGGSPNDAWTGCTTSRAVAGRPRFPPEDRHKVVVLATQDPADAGVPVSHWSLTDLATKILQDTHYAAMSRATVGRILRECELRPHRCVQWLHSEDPEFEKKVLEVARLYLNAPVLYRQGELVLCCDEKTGIQALERKYPDRPAQPGGRSARREFEYVRHGTRCLLATLVVPTGQVLADVTARRTSLDFFRHLRGVVEQFPAVEKFHWVLDNLNTHWSLSLCRLVAKLSGVRCPVKQLKRGAARRAFLSDPAHKHVIHYTPKHGSWMNQIEIWFGTLSRRVLRRGNFSSRRDLTEKILAFIDYYNRHLAHPYRWTYTGKPLVA
jgi:DDE superfamily endonuclease